MKQFTHTVKDKVGIHARPAAQLARALAPYKSTVLIERNGERVSAKKGIAIMGLAIKYGETVSFIVEGEDETETLSALREFCCQNI
ncbi:HPr family phosphocarrier protein [Clostridium sp. KNHs216]|uniref:HPr family phosphocarrier protein n=1 Tax=Clostridium sp. KNHs216 TaxID=1550235 RepID=UPI00114ED12C|nr:HPr family phosphocarrier protein [Clostridium sp. KNHs216]TQI66034.1 phosphocarrier protein [Clostridium sp. KNHs216]